MQNRDENSEQLPTSRFMKRMIVLCAVTLILILAAAYVGIWYGKNMDTWLVVGCGAFGLELGYNAWIKLTEKKQLAGNPKTDNKNLTNKVNG